MISSEGKKLCLSCARFKLSGREFPRAHSCGDCDLVNEDVRARVMAKARAVIVADRLHQEELALRELPHPGAPVNWGNVFGLRVEPSLKEKRTFEKRYGKRWSRLGDHVEGEYDNHSGPENLSISPVPVRCSRRSASNSRV